jgi:tripartite-type tricarboxylate transporter receptor subunit TctC
MHLRPERHRARTTTPIESSKKLIKEKPMNSLRRSLGANVASMLGVLVTLIATSAFADYPEKPLKIIVPWATGGSTDALARTLAQRMAQTIGQSIIVENRPGAAAAIGTVEMAKAAPDGYTLGIIELPHALAPSVVAKLPYDLLKDLQPVAMIGTSPMVLFTSSALPARSVPELIAAAKAAPGQISIAHSGNGTSSHVVAELLQQRAGVKFNLAGYKGSGPALLDVAGGHVQAHFATLASGIGPMKSGKVNAMAVAAEQRMDALKETPTFADAGIKDFVLEQWWGVVVPKGTPASVVEKLRAEISAAINHQSMQDRMRDLAVQPRPMGPTQFAAFVDSEIKRWAAVVKAAGIKPE